MNHEAWRLLVSSYRDGELSPEDRARVETHLADCPECARVLDDYRKIGEALRALPRREPSRELWFRVRAALPGRRPARSLWVRLLPVASAAVVLLVALTLFLYQGLGSQARLREVRAPQGPPANPPAAGSPLPMPMVAPQPTSAPEQPELGRAYLAKAGCPGEVLTVELVELAKRSDQTLPSPRLEGTLYDDAGRPLVGATLVVTGTSGWLGSAVTGADGRFTLALPGAGSYRVALVLAAPRGVALEDSGLPQAEGDLGAMLNDCPTSGVTLPLVAIEAREVAILSLRTSGY